MKELDVDSFSLQYAIIAFTSNICLPKGCLRLSNAVDLFTELPKPSHGDLP